MTPTTQIETYTMLRSIREHLARKAGEVILYQKSWSAETCIDHILKPYTGRRRYDPRKLTHEQLQELGFGKWEEGSSLMLIPVWCLPFLPDEIETESIDGSKHTKKSEIDTDNRAGLLAYGIRPDPIQIAAAMETA